MIRNLILFLFISSTLSVSHAQSSDPMDEIKSKLAADGLMGLVHGADVERGLYVFSYHIPGDFFTRYNFSLLARSQAQRELLKTLQRHDRVLVKGKLGGQKTPQPHILIASIEVLEKYNPEIESPGGHWTKDTKLPDDLKDKTEITVQVHAVAGEGQVLVVEYREAILPVVVPAKLTNFTKDLYRGDLIQIQFIIQKSPGRPTHLVLNGSVDAPVKVLERLVDIHNQPVTKSGRLVLFPKSPTINRDVWALEEALPEGLFRYYTLVNFKEENGQFPELEKIGKKLRALWDAHPESVFHARNKFINLKIRIRAKSEKATVFTPDQANAQLHLRAEDIILLD